MKGVRSLELGRSGLLFSDAEPTPSPPRAEAAGAPKTASEDDAALRKRLAVPHDRRMWDLFRALGRGWSVEQIHELDEDRPLVPAAVRRDPRDARRRPRSSASPGSTPAHMRRLKRAGFGDAEIALADRRRPRRRCATRRAVAEPEAGLQARRHLRGRVRVVHAVHVQRVRADVRVESRTAATRSSSSAAVRTGSARASSSTTAAATRPSRCATKGSRR